MKYLKTYNESKYKPSYTARPMPDKYRLRCEYLIDKYGKLNTNNKITHLSEESEILQIDINDDYRLDIFKTTDKSLLNMRELEMKLQAKELGLL